MSFFQGCAVNRTEAEVREPVVAKCLNSSAMAALGGYIAWPLFDPG